MATCPNCGAELMQGAKFCAECGTPIPVTSMDKTGLSLSVGDAAAINGSVQVSDSHNQVINNSTTSSVVNNIAHVERQKSPEEILRNKMQTFRQKCQEVFADGIQSSEEKRQLDDLQFQLGLDDETAAHIVADVRQKSQRKSAVLGSIQQIDYNKLTAAISVNDKEIINRLLPKLEAMVQKYSAEDVQYTYYMLQAVLHPKDTISLYQHHNEDKYWQMFWTSVAYRIEGDVVESEKLLNDVGDKWVDTIPPENALVLASINAILDQDIETAKTLFDHITDEFSSFLKPVVVSLYVLFNMDLLSAEEFDKMDSEGRFYQCNLFNRVYNEKRQEHEQKERARLEEERKIKEEQAATEAKARSEADGQERMCKARKDAESKQTPTLQNNYSNEYRYSVCLREAGSDSMLIMDLKNLFKIDFAKAKNIVNNVPYVLMENVCLEDAKELQQIVEKRGGVKVSIDYIIPWQIKRLIEDFYMGVQPNEEQMDEISDLINTLHADSKEVMSFLAKIVNGPTKQEQREKEEEQRRIELVEAEERVRREREDWMLAAARERAQAAEEQRVRDRMKRN